MQRLATLIQKNQVAITLPGIYSFSSEYRKLMDRFEYTKAFDLVWAKIQKLNQVIDETKPWTLAKNGERHKLEKCLGELANELMQINYELMPFLPNAAMCIAEIFTEPIAAPAVPLFPKK